MKRSLLLLLVLVLVSLFVVSTALASDGEPLGNCPNGFQLHMWMDHEDHPEHHIGLAEDINGDGWICMKELSNGLHVHMDNVLP